PSVSLSPTFPKGVSASFSVMELIAPHCTGAVPGAVRCPSCRQPPPQLVLVAEEVEQLLPVERDDRDALQVFPVQPVVLLDVALLQGERQLRAQPLQLLQRLLAEMAAGAAVEHDGARHRPRSPDE